MGYKRNSFRVSVGKSERNKPLENPRDRPSYNAKINLTEIRWGEFRMDLSGSV